MKHLFVLSLLLIFAASCSWPPIANPQKKQLRPCIVQKVQKFSVGQKSTMQLDPEWKAFTSCGEFTSRKKVDPGDTIWVEIKEPEK